jgi:hypothetical protein
MARVQVAYEEAHECKEGCNCAKDSGYLDAVQASLADLGSDDPSGDVARHAKYVRGAQKARLEPKQAAAMILAMSRPDEGYQPRYRFEDVAESVAHEYIAVDSRGKKVFGPTRDYQEAKMHAEHARGWVAFHAGAKEETPRVTREEPNAATRRAIVDWANGVKARSRYGSTLPTLSIDSPRLVLIEWLVNNDPNGLYTDDANRREGGDPLTLDEAWGLIDDFRREDMGEAGEKSSKYERCVRKVKAKGDAANPWAVCHAALGKEPEPYTRKNLNWHRDANGNYWNSDSGYGKIVVRQRTQDKRAGKLAWFAVIKKIEVAQGETRMEVNEAVEKRLRNPGKVASEATEPPAAPAMSRLSAVVERDPEAVRADVPLDSAKDVARVMRDYQARSGYEAIYLLAASKQGEMIGSPVELARGQVSSVRIAVDQVNVAATDRVGAGAVRLFLSHYHPSGKARCSSSDRKLSKAVKDMMAVALPETEYGGHVVVGRGEFEVC